MTFFAFDDDVVAKVFSKPETICSLIFDGEAPVAGGFIWKPASDDVVCLRNEHEGVDIGLKAGCYLQLDNTVVLPGYRGNNLQRTVVSNLLSDVELPVVATVAPSNAASLKTLEDCGFRIQRTVERRGGFQRHVMLIDKGLLCRF